MSPLRVGVVDYLNAMPLWHALRNDPDVELVPALPSELAAMLSEGAIDAGLLPVIEYFRQPDVSLVRGVGVCAWGNVRSVRIFLKQPIEEVERVRLDASSRTSAALTQVILRDLYQLSPTWVQGRVLPEELNRLEEDAALIIGDPALVALVRAEFDSIDLSHAWRELTGLPFVFAGWLVRKSLSADAQSTLAAKLKDARAQGIESIPAIAREYAAEKGLERFLVEDYLHNTIRYKLCEREEEALAEFGKRATAHDLCQARVLEFIEEDID